MSKAPTRNVDLEAEAALHYALSYEPRLRMAVALVKGPKAVADLAKIAGLSQSGTSQQLAVLRRMGFVRATTLARSRIYSLSPLWAERVTEVLRAVAA